MARISTYVIDGSIVDDDKVIGSDANNSMITKNYTVGDLAAYIGYSIGNNYFVPYNNASQNVDLGNFNLTANSIIVGNQLILGGTAGLVGQVLMSNGSGSPASWGYNIGSQTLRDVLIQGNTGDKNLILSNSTSSSIILDLDKVYSTSVGLRIFDSTLNSVSSLFPNNLNVQDSSLQKTASYSAGGIRYSSNGFNVDINANSYANQTLLYPSSSGVLVTSVNGVSADLTGNITINLGGTVTSVGVTAGTGISASVANPTTTPNITITNTAPDQTVVLNNGAGIAVTGTYPNFTITNTGSSVTPAALTKTDDTNVTLTLGGSPSTALLAATSLTLGWTGTLADTRIASATNWNSKQAGSTNLTSLSGLTYAATSFVKMTASGVFGLDTNTYLTSAITSLNGLTGTTQTFAVGTSGSDFGISSSSTTHTFNLPDAALSVRGVVTTGTQTFEGQKTFRDNIFIQKTSSTSQIITIGFGGGVADYDNLAFGSLVLNSSTSSSFSNLGVGHYSLQRITTGQSNIGLGNYTLNNLINGQDNIAIGNSTLSKSIGSSNTVIGSYAGSELISGNNNTLIGTSVINNTTSGSNNTIIGKITGLGASLSDNVIISDGSGNIRFKDDGSKTIIPRLAGTSTRMVVAGANGELSTQAIAGGGTVTSVAALSLGTSGTDLSSSVANSTTTPVITLNVPDASATARGVITTGAQTIAGAKTFSTTPILSSLTVSQILALDGSGNIQSLPVATYPSLTELSYVKGVTSAIQTQIGTKQATITGAATTITSSDLTVSRALISNASGKVAVSATTDTELGYVSGVTSGIQSQLNGKQATLTNPITGTGTNNEIAYFNSTGSTIASLSTATYPSLTQLSYVKGVTSAVQTQLDSKGYTLALTSVAGNLVTGTTYYFGNQGRSITTTADVSRVYIPKTGTIKKAYITQYGATAGTSVSITANIRLNNTTDTVVATSSTTSTFRVFNNNALSISVVEGDYIEIKITNTNTVAPTSVIFAGTLYIE